MTRMKSIALAASLLLSTGLATGLTAQPAFAQRGIDTVPGTDSWDIQAPRFDDLSGEQIPEAPRWGDLSGEQTPEAPRADQGS